MNVRISIGNHGDEDTVILSDGSRCAWSKWMTRTEQAVKAVRTALNEKQITPAAHGWLKLCGVENAKQFEDLERHLPQLRQPMSSANGRCCIKCRSRIWVRMALLTGLGSECRRGENRARWATKQTLTALKRSAAQG